MAIFISLHVGTVKFLKKVMHSFNYYKVNILDKKGLIYSPCKWIQSTDIQNALLLVF